MIFQSQASVKIEARIPHKGKLKIESGTTKRIRVITRGIEFTLTKSKFFCYISYFKYKYNKKAVPVGVNN